MGLSPFGGGGGASDYIIPVGVVGIGALIAWKLGLLKFDRDATAEVVTDTTKLSYPASTYKNDADSLYNDLNAYWTNIDQLMLTLTAMKTGDDIKELYKQFGHKNNTSNLGILNINVGQGKDLKQWLLDFHTTRFDNKWVTDYFAKAGI